MVLRSKATALPLDNIRKTTPWIRINVEILMATLDHSKATAAATELPLPNPVMVMALRHLSSTAAMEYDCLKMFCILHKTDLIIISPLLLPLHNTAAVAAMGPPMALLRRKVITLKATVLRLPRPSRCNPLATVLPMDIAFSTPTVRDEGKLFSLGSITLVRGASLEAVSTMSRTCRAI